MKRFAKTAAVFVALAGLLCMSSCSTLGIPNVFDLLFGSSSASTVAEWQPQGNATYKRITFYSDGTCLGDTDGDKGDQGTWSGGMADGETLTVTIKSTTYSGTVRNKDYDLVVTLGAWGSYKKYVSVK